MNTTHEARIEKHLAVITKKMVPGWYEYDVPRVGRVSVNCMTPEGAKAFGGSQCWLRLRPTQDRRMDGSEYEATSSLSWDEELRGSAESVAKQLCRFLGAPSKAAQAAAETIESRWFSKNPRNSTGYDGLRCEEIAAWLDLNEMDTFRAMDLLAERGLARNDGPLGWFRTSNEIR